MVLRASSYVTVSARALFEFGFLVNILMVFWYRFCNIAFQHLEIIMYVFKNDYHEEIITKATWNQQKRSISLLIQIHR